MAFSAWSSLSPRGPVPSAAAPATSEEHEPVSQGQSAGDGFCPLCLLGMAVSHPQF